MPYSSSSRLTFANLLFNSTLALINLPVDLILTKSSFSNSLLSSHNKFKSFNFILLLTKFFFGPTIISFFFASISMTYRGSLSATFIPFLCPIVKLIIPS